MAQIRWPKTLFGFFCKTVWKNQNELFGQPYYKKLILLMRKMRTKEMWFLGYDDIYGEDICIPMADSC